MAEMDHRYARFGEKYLKKMKRVAPKASSDFVAFRLQWKRLMAKRINTRGGI
jgi:hypothetical protein